MRKLILVFACSLLLANCSDSNENANKTSGDKTSEAVEAQTSTSQIAIAIDTLTADGYVKRARIHLAQQEVGNAMRDINTALSMDGKNVDALLVLSDIYYAIGDQDNIMLTLNKATEIAPSDPRPIVKLAELSFLQGNSRMADAYIDRALELDHNYPQAYYMRGIIDIYSNDTVRALKNFMQARSLDDSFFDPVIQIANIYAAQRNDLAMDFYDAAANIQPDNFGIYYDKAMYMQDNGYPEGALAIYDSLDVKMPGSYDVAYNKGYVYLVYLLNNDKAIECFNKALEIDPKSVNALLNKGIAYEQKGDFIEAKSIYLQVLKYNPNYQLAIDALHRIGN